MSAEIHCYRVGTRVRIAEGITGLITAISIRCQRDVTYEVSWWNGRDQRVEWFAPWQIDEIEATEPLKIGFPK